MKSAHWGTGAVDPAAPGMQRTTHIWMKYVFWACLTLDLGRLSDVESVGADLEGSLRTCW
jgi:hypothetical protein